VSSRADATSWTAEVLATSRLSDHLVRLELGGAGLDGFSSTGVPDEWVALTVPGQFQSRYYTVRSWDGTRLVLDVVLHDHGLVTEWASGSPVGDRVGIGAPKGSYAPPAGAGWVLLVGDLTALPAIARILEDGTGVPTTVLLEADQGHAGLLPATDATITWSRPPAPAESALAAVVEDLDWPAGDGYFWMGGESSQMRAIRKHLMRERRLPSAAYDVMGYWRKPSARRTPAVDPGPIYRAGRAAGRSDAEIWADYDAAQERAQAVAQDPHQDPEEGR